MNERNQVVYIVDDDDLTRDYFSEVLSEAGLTCRTIESAEAFLLAYDPQQPGCLLLAVALGDYPTADKYLAEALKRMRADPALGQRLAEAGRRTVAERLTPEAWFKTLPEKVQAAALRLKAAG